jgi:hypothetical protein
MIIGLISEGLDVTEGSKLPGDRVDLIKRLFAVTISVGFATRFSMTVFNSAYIDHSALKVGLLTAEHWRDGVLLIISMIAVILSWEGYLKAIEASPLEDRVRFYTDITLVFFYLMLMLSSQIFHLWFHLLVLIFILYFIWDIARIVAARKDVSQRAAPRPLSAASIAITAVWLGFFTLLDCSVYFSYVRVVDDWLAFVGGAASAFSGLVLYRVDKSRRFGWCSKVLLVFLALLPLMPSLIVLAVGMG